MPRNDIPSLPTDPEPPRRRRTVSIEIGPVHLHVERIRPLPHWLATTLAAAAGAIADHLHLLHR